MLDLIGFPKLQDLARIQIWSLKWSWWMVENFHGHHGFSTMGLSRKPRQKILQSNGCFTGKIVHGWLHELGGPQPTMIMGPPLGPVELHPQISEKIHIETICKICKAVYWICRLDIRLIPIKLSWLIASPSIIMSQTFLVDLLPVPHVCLAQSSPATPSFGAALRRL